jgi:hypothetical protein
MLFPPSTVAEGSQPYKINHKCISMFQKGVRNGNSIRYGGQLVYEAIYFKSQWRMQAIFQLAK